MESYFWIVKIFFRLRVFYAGAKRCAIVCRKIHFLHHWRALGHRYDGVLRRLADHRSNVRTNSSDYPCLVENEPACSFQLACSSGSSPFSASRCPAHELMDVYQTNCILFAQTAPWSSATWSSTMSNPIEIVDRLNYAGYANSHRYALAHLDPRAFGRKRAMKLLDE